MQYHTRLAIMYLYAMVTASHPLVCNVAILRVVTMGLPVSSRFSRSIFFIATRKFSTLTPANQWLNFTYLRSHAFDYVPKQELKS